MIQCAVEKCEWNKEGRCDTLPQLNKEGVCIYKTLSISTSVLLLKIKELRYDYYLLQLTSEALNIVCDFISAGRVIYAIKHFRIATKAGLKEAKEIITMFLQLNHKLDDHGCNNRSQIFRDVVKTLQANN